MERIEICKRNLGLHQILLWATGCQPLELSSWGCFYQLTTLTAWWLSPECLFLQDSQTHPLVPTQASWGTGRKLIWPHHLYGSTCSHEQREDGLFSLAIQKGKQCPGSGWGGSESYTVEGPRTESQYEESFTRLARSQGPQAEEGQGGESPGIGAGRALLLHWLTRAMGRFRKTLRLYWENTQTRFFYCSKIDIA